MSDLNIQKYLERNISSPFAQKRRRIKKKKSKRERESKNVRM
jgi:hypothetical protein